MVARGSELISLGASGEELLEAYTEASTGIICGSFQSRRKLELSTAPLEATIASMEVAEASKEVMKAATEMSEPSMDIVEGSTAVMEASMEVG